MQIPLSRGTLICTKLRATKMHRHHETHPRNSLHEGALSGCVLLFGSKPRVSMGKQDAPDWLPMTAIWGIRISFDALKLTT